MAFKFFQFMALLLVLVQTPLVCAQFTVEEFSKQYVEEQFGATTPDECDSKFSDDDIRTFAQKITSNGPGCFKEIKFRRTKLHSHHEICKCLKDKKGINAAIPQSMAYFAPKKSSMFLSENIPAIYKPFAADYKTSGVRLNLPANKDDITQKQVQVRNKILIAASLAFQDNGVVNMMAAPKTATSNLPKIDDELLTENTFAPGQCIGAREYIAFRTLPDDEDMKVINASKPDEWNHRHLRPRYDELMKLNIDERKKYEKEIVKLKTKLRFLNRNPLMKLAFAIEDSQQSKSIKQKLHSVLKNYSNSGHIDLNDGKSDQYYKETINIFSDPEVFKQIVNESEKEKALNEKQLGKIKVTPEVYTYETVTRNFVAMTGKRSPESCIGNHEEIEACIRVFASWCSHLDEIVPKLKPEFELPNLQDDLDILSANDFNTNFNTNIDLQKFNDQECKSTNRPKDKGKESDVETFWSFQKKHCASLNNAGDCVGNKPEDIIKLRNKYFAKYSVPVAGEDESSTRKRRTFRTLAAKKPTKDVKFSSQGPMSNEQVAQNLASFRAKSGLGESYMSDLPENVNETVSRAETSPQSMQNTDANISPSSDDSFSNSQHQQTQQQPLPETYSSSSNFSQPERQIQNMDEDNQRDLLNDLRKDFSDFKDDKTVDHNSAVAAAEAGKMQARIDALEQLLAKQKELTKSQYDLLNKTIAEKAMTEKAAATKQEIAENDEDELNPPTNKNKSSFTPSVARAPASVKEQNFNANNSKAGSASTSSRTSSAASVREAADSLARETAKLAKLVNRHENSDGSITIEAVGPGTAKSGNALSLSLTDAQYKIMQENPTGLNLSLIENRIPAELITKLKNKAEIIILLENGKNLPFEVKVQMINKHLVYRLNESGKPITPVPRVHIYNALKEIVKDPTRN